jgi:hypothetical protein
MSLSTSVNALPSVHVQLENATAINEPDIGKMSSPSLSSFARATTSKLELEGTTTSRPRTAARARADRARYREVCGVGDQFSSRNDKELLLIFSWTSGF